MLVLLPRRCQLSVLAFKLILSLRRCTMAHICYHQPPLIWWSMMSARHLQVFTLISISSQCMVRADTLDYSFGREISRRWPAKSLKDAFSCKQGWCLSISQAATCLQDSMRSSIISRPKTLVTDISKKEMNKVLDIALGEFHRHFSVTWDMM